MIKKNEMDILASRKLCTLVQAILEDKKAEDIVVLDLTRQTAITDYMIIASGQSTRQVGAMAQVIQTELKKYDIMAPVEGMSQCDWVLIDAFDVIVHLFRPEVRTYYNLEKMWGIYPPDMLPE